MLNFKKIAMILILVFTLILSGCGSKDVSSHTLTLTVAVAGDIENLDPTFASFPRSTEAIANIYEQLTTYNIIENEDGLKISDTANAVPNLVEDISISENGKEYTFKLRQGIKFASGNPMTTEDIKYSYDRAANAGEGSGTFDLSVATISKPVEIIDEYTFKIYTDETNPTALNVLAMGGLSIFDSKLMLENATDDDLWSTEWCKKHTAGSGPWVIEEWVSGSEIIFKVNEHYWGEKPAYDKMIWKIIPSAANRVMLLENAEVDVAEDISAKDVEALAKKDGIKLMSFPSQNMFIMPMNFEIAPFDNVLVRQAIAHAVPYDEIINNVYYGNARASRGPVPVGTPGHYDDVKNYQTNLDVARELLVEAGYEDGLDIDLYIDNSKFEHEQAAVFIQGSLSKIGINLNIEKLNPAAFQEKKYTSTLPMYLEEQLAWVDEPGYVLSLSWATGTYSNNNNYSNLELDSKSHEARFTLDEAKRTQLFNECQDMLMEDCPAAFLCQPNYNLVMRDDITDFVMFFDELLRFQFMK